LDTVGLTLARSGQLIATLGLPRIRHIAGGALAQFTRVSGLQKSVELERFIVAFAETPEFQF
jgi:hypothetical protein